MLRKLCAILLVVTLGMMFPTSLLAQGEDGVVVGDWQITIKSASQADELDGGPSGPGRLNHTPGAGKTFLVVELHWQSTAGDQTLEPVTNAAMQVTDANGEVVPRAGLGMDNTFCVNTANSTCQMTLSGTHSEVDMKYVFPVSRAAIDMEFTLEIEGQALPPFPVPYAAEDVPMPTDAAAPLLPVPAEDLSLIAWDTAPQVELLGTVDAFSSGVLGISFVGDDGLTMVAAGCRAGEIANCALPGARRWDVRSGEVNDINEGYGQGILRLELSPDGSLAAVANQPRDGRIWLWDVASGEEVAVLEGHTDAVFGLAFSPDGTTLASISNDNSVRLWDTASGTETSTFPIDRGTSLLAFSPDGKRLAIGGSPFIEGVHIWDVERGLSENFLMGNFGTVSDFAFSPDGSLLAICADSTTGGAIELWDVANGYQVRSMLGHPRGAFRVNFSPDGSLLVTSGWAGDGSVRLWEVESGAELAILTEGGSAFNTLQFNDQGTLLAGGRVTGEIYVWYTTAESSGEIAPPDPGDDDTDADEPEPPADSDGDGVLDDIDACPDVAGPLDGCPYTGTVANNVNLRQGPGTNTAVVGQVTPDQEFYILGRNTASDWLRMQTLEGDLEAWIFARLVTTAAPIAELPDLQAEPPAAGAGGSAGVDCRFRLADTTVTRGEPLFGSFDSVIVDEGTDVVATGRYVDADGEEWLQLDNGRWLMLSFLFFTNIPAECHTLPTVTP